MKDSWIKITDVHPEASVKPLLLCIDNRFVIIGRFAAFYQDTEPSWRTSDDERLENAYGMDVTHWQPIEYPE